MKIKKIHIEKVDLGLVNTYTIAYKTVDAVHAIVLKIETQSAVGLGSCNPSKYVVGEDVHETFELLNNENWDWLIGQDVRQIYGLLDQVYTKFKAHPGVTAALDIALLDLFGKAMNIPLVDFWGRKYSKMLTSMTIGIMDTDATCVQAKKEIASGFKILKIKTGSNLEEDFEKIAKLRETIGSDILIRVDANQGYDLNAFKTFFHAVEKYNLELIEQPLSVQDHFQLAQLDETYTQTVAADESIVNSKNALDIISKANNSCQIFNIKLMKTGGVKEALNVAQIAKLSNKDLFWGCNDESVISISAALHAAFSCAHTKYLDLDGSIGLLSDPAEAGFLIEDGYLIIQDKPGFGCKLK
jgi:L-alanine-DL-glutamate epimerase-like enolase superfamily enzyme